MLPTRTVNQINGFIDRNHSIVWYLKFKDLRHTEFDSRWFEYTKCLDRPIGRHTLRGNYIYSNIGKSLSAFLGYEFNSYDYKKHLISIMVEDMKYQVELDKLDGVTVSYTLPFKGEYYNKQIFKKHRLQASVPLEHNALLPYIQKLHAKHFFPITTTLGKIQRINNLTKCEAISALKEYYKQPSNERFQRVDMNLDTILSRRLLKKYNIKTMVSMTRELYTKLVKRGYQERRLYVDKFPTSSFLDSTHFDGDVDELIDEIESNFEDNTIYV